MDRRHSIAALLIVGAASCADARSARRPSSGTPSPPAGFLSPALLGADSTFHAADEKGSWRAGDEVIYGITMASPVRSQRWLVRIKVCSQAPEVELAGEPPHSAQQVSGDGSEAASRSRPVLLEVQIFGEDGKVQQTSRVLASADDLDHGFYPGCLAGMAAGRITTAVEGNRIRISPPSLTDEEAKTVDRSLATFNALFRLASSALKPIVDTVVARPSLTEILLHGGVIHLTTSAGIVGLTEPSTAFAGAPDQVLSFPFEVRAYDSPALRGRLFVIDSRPPFLPGGGVVAIEAAHPEDPAATVAARLLAAKRGPVTSGSE